jgi:hypothetical protein
MWQRADSCIRLRLRSEAHVTSIASSVRVRPHGQWPLTANPRTRRLLRKAVRRISVLSARCPPHHCLPGTHPACLTGRPPRTAPPEHDHQRGDRADRRRPDGAPSRCALPAAACAANAAPRWGQTVMVGRAVRYRKRPMPLAKVSERVAGLDHEPTRWAGWTGGDLVKTALGRLCL